MINGVKRFLLALTALQTKTDAPPHFHPLNILIHADELL